MLFRSDIDRISVNLWASLAMRGKCSQICSPGTVVGIGLNSPRYWSGDSGFKSHVSCCAGPPHMNNTMHAFARRGGVLTAVDALKNCGNPSPNKLNAPARKNSRRRKAGLKNESIGIGVAMNCNPVGGLNADR